MHSMLWVLFVYFIIVVILIVVYIIIMEQRKEEKKKSTHYISHIEEEQNNSEAGANADTTGGEAVSQINIVAEDDEVIEDLDSIDESESEQES